MRGRLLYIAEECWLVLACVGEDWLACLGAVQRKNDTSRTGVYRE